ncbi:MAG TPA: hypothetical protein VFS39_03000 [Nitrospira sp.]|nr:hypothetical protein [Nitrospira sp.]
MKRQTPRRMVFFLALGIFLVSGCFRSGKELNLSSFSPDVDQRRIADYYSQQAVALRQRAAELDGTVEMYERMFGADSDWVSGTRLLAESYRYEAEERERRAREHLSTLPSALNDR